MPAQAMKVMLLLLLALLVVSQATTGKCRHNHRALFRLTLCLHKDLLTWGQAFFTCENPKKGAYRLFFLQLQCQTLSCVGRSRASAPSCCAPCSRDPSVPATMAWRSAAYPCDDHPWSMSGLVALVGSAAVTPAVVRLYLAALCGALYTWSWWKSLLPPGCPEEDSTRWSSHL